MPNEKITLEIAAKAIGQASIDDLSASLNRFSAAAESAGGRADKGFGGAKRAVEEAASAAEGATLKWNKLGLAIKDVFEGRGGYAAVEGGYFLQSLGAMGLAAGAVAVGVYEIAKHWGDTAKAAEKAQGAFSGLNAEMRTVNDGLRLSNIELANEIAKLEGKPQNAIAQALAETRLEADKLAESLVKDFDRLEELMAKQKPSWWHVFTPSGSAIDEHEFGTSGFGGIKKQLADAEGDPAKSKGILDSDIAYLKQELDVAKLNAAASPGSLANYQPEIERLQEYIRQHQAEIERIDLTGKHTDLEGGVKKAEASKALTESRNRAATEATEALRKGDQESFADLQADHRVTLSEEIDFWEERYGNELKNIDREREISRELGKLYQERNVRLGELIKAGAEIEKREAEKKREFEKKNVDLSYSIGLDYDNDQTRKKQEDLRAGTEKTRGDADIRLSGLNQDRLSASRAAALTPIGASDSIKVAARLAELEKIRQVDVQERDIQRAAQQQIIEDTSRLYKKGTTEYETEAKKKTDIARVANQKIYDDTTNSLEAIHAEREKELESFKSQVGSAYDAATSHSIPQFIRSQALGLGRTITANAAAMALPAIEKLIPHTSGTLGKLLSDTPFGPDPLKTAGGSLSKAAADLIDAAAALKGKASVPGAGGIPGGGSGISGGGVAGLGGAAGSDGYDMASPGDPGTADAGWEPLPVISHGLSSGSASGFGFNGGTIAAAAGVGLEGYQAFKGFAKGGAGGALEGTSGVLGAAAGIAAMTGVGAPIAAGLAIASAVTGLVGSFLDGATRRANAISTALGQAQYIAPTALNVTQSSGGTFADFDAKGNLRTSNFSPYPQVSQGFIWAQSHGLFGGPPTFYNVPGGQTSQFGAPVAPPPVVHNHYYTVNAMDVQSFNDFAQRNHMAIGDAAAHNLIQGGHGRLSSEIDRKLGGG